MQGFTSLGLKPDIIYRHPFPGPGLAIRVICQEDPYIDDNFKSTNLIINAVVNYTDRIEEVIHSNTVIPNPTNLPVTS